MRFGGVHGLFSRFMLLSQVLGWEPLPSSVRSEGTHLRKGRDGAAFALARARLCMLAFRSAGVRLWVLNPKVGF